MIPNLRVLPEINGKLRQLAKDENTTLSYQVNKILEHWYDSEQRATSIAMSSYPECEKFAKIANVFAQISEYFNHRDIVFSVWEGNNIRPLQKSPVQIAYEILEIDEKKLEQERSALIASL